MTNCSHSIAFSYSLPALVLASMAVSYYVFVPKLYAELGSVSVQALGAAVVATRIWDAVTDPLIGVLSDRTVSKQGRRKPWLRWSVIPLCICFALLFAVTTLPAGLHLSWFVALSVLFFLFWTMYSIPYEALGQELVQDYDERTSLFAVRDGAFVAGTLFAALVPLGTEWLLADREVWSRWLFIAFCYSLLLLAFTARLQIKVPGGTHALKQQVRPGMIESIRSSLANQHFRHLLLAYTLASFGSALPATLFLFYVDHVLGSARGPAFLALYFFIGIAALPLWTKLSARVGKKQAWLAALAVNTGGFLAVFFLSPGQELAYAILISISALGYGASLALPSSMQADVIDAEELSTGVRKEGQFLGAWSLAKKTAAAIGAGVALWLLGSAGFESQVKVQDPEVLFALRALYCLVPCLCSFAAMLAIRNYSLGRTEHEQILAALAERKQEKLS